MPNPIKTRLADLLDHDLFTPRELSWLSFNARVLQEAADSSVPVIERLRYLGIFSNNSDEFFRVRVAEVRRLISVAGGANKQQSKELLAAIQKRVSDLQREFDRNYKEIVQELAARRIYMINELQLDQGQAEFVQSYFDSTVLPELEPILLQESQAIPALNDESLYLAVDIKSADKYHYALVEVPTDTWTVLWKFRAGRARRVRYSLFWTILSAPVCRRSFAGFSRWIPPRPIVSSFPATPNWR